MADKGTSKAVVSKVSDNGFQVEGQKDSKKWFNYTKESWRHEQFDIPGRGDFIEFDWSTKDDKFYVKRIKILSEREPLGGGEEPPPAPPPVMHPSCHPQTPYGYLSIEDFKHKQLMDATRIHYAVCFKGAIDIVTAGIIKNGKALNDETLDKAKEKVNELATDFFTYYVDNEKDLASALEVAQANFDNMEVDE